MVEIDEARLKRKGIKPPKKCPCGGGYKFDLLESNESGMIWALASCPVCRKQLIWNSGTKMWSVFEPSPTGVPPVDEVF
jgi:hypothetical protein